MRSVLCIGSLALGALVANCGSTEPNLEMSVSGLVLEAETGEPIPDAWVGIMFLLNRSTNLVHAETRTDEHGRFELLANAWADSDCGSPGQYRFSSRNEGYVAHSVDWEPVRVNELPGSTTLYVECGVDHYAVVWLEEEEALGMIGSTD